MRHYLAFFSALMITLALCQAKATSKQQHHEAPILYFSNWSEYISADLLAQFTQESGIKVIYSTYDSNESLYAKLKIHPLNTYDLIVPSTYFVSKMRAEGMLQKMDKHKLSNFKHLDPNLLNLPFDSNNDYSIPYLWGMTAIGINNSEVAANSVHAWADLWDEKYRNRLLLTDDAREVFHIALRKLGYSGNTNNPQHIAAAYQALRQLLPNVLLFNSDAPANPFMEGEVNIGMLWSGAAHRARQAGFPIQIVWPQEGAIFWMDSLVIPVGARHKENAMKFIDFILRPEIAAQIARHVGFSTPNQSAKALLPKAVTQDPSCYPPQALIQQGEWQIDVGSEANQRYENYFQRLKMGR